jgi:hypothetical protein
MTAIEMLVGALAIFAQPAGDAPAPGAAAPPPAEAGPATEESAASDLDAELLEGLEEDDPLDDAGESRQENEPAPGGGDLDEELLRGLEDGEDIGEEEPLARLGRRMREVEERIAGTKADEPTQKLQREILEDLKKLIEEAIQQQQQSQSQQAQRQQSQRTASRQRVRQSQPSGQQPALQPAETPSQDSTEQLRPDQVTRPDMRIMNEMAKRIWGHLPPKQRDEMLQNHMEEFLPAYESLIGEYFKALAERQERN